MQSARQLAKSASPSHAVALVEDDPHYRQFLESALDSSGRFRVILQADSAEAAQAWSGSPVPAVALVDVGLPGRAGSALVADLLQRFPELLIIMVSARDADTDILESIRAGAIGYVLKGGTGAEIILAIDDALAGGAPMSPSIARRVLDAMRSMPLVAARGLPESLPALTAREEQIMEWVAAGASDLEVAKRLGVTRTRVKNCLLGVYAKWRVRTRTQAAIKFVRQRRSRS